MKKPVCKLCGEGHYWTEACGARDRLKGEVVTDFVEVPRAAVKRASKAVAALPAPAQVVSVDRSRGKRGEVTGTQVVVRLQPEMLARLDAVCGDGSRAEAIRVLLERELPK